MRTNRSKFIKLLLIASMLVMMLLLCGCRTRITNNTAVNSSITDETGSMKEAYDLRREELGIPVAEEPLIKGMGSDEDYEDYEYSGDLDYEPQTDDSWEDDTTFDDQGSDSTTQETPTTDSTTTTPTTTPTTKKPSTTTTRRPSTTTTTSTVKVTLDPNGGKCSSKAVFVTKGGTYGSLPDATREGKNFAGWYTKQKDGKKVTSTTKVTNGKAHKLYAHWNNKKTYTVTFVGNGNGDEVTIDPPTVTVTEDGEYGTLPVPKRVGCQFNGWYTKASGGNQIQEGDKIVSNKNHKLYARWGEKDMYVYWNNEFKKIANSQTEVWCAAYTSSEAVQLRNIIEACKGKVPKKGEPMDFVVIIDLDPAGDALSDDQAYDGVNVVRISSNALYGDEKQKLTNKLMLLDAIHNGCVGADRLDQAQMDLGTSEGYPLIYTNVYTGGGDTGGTTDEVAEQAQTEGGEPPVEVVP